MREGVRNGVDEGERMVAVLYCDHIEPPVIYAWPEGAIFFLTKKIWTQLETRKDGLTPDPGFLMYASICLFSAEDRG